MNSTPNPTNKYDPMDQPPAYCETDPQKYNQYNPNQTTPPQVSTYPSYQPNNEYTHVNMMHQHYGATICDQPVTVPVTQVILIGGCPACRVGILEDSFSFLGILCAILFFPLGILCCLALKDKRCSNCHASF